MTQREDQVQARTDEEAGSVEERLRAATVGAPVVLGGTIELRAYDEEWPALYRQEEQRVRTALGDSALRVEHVGSTAVPGLPAKPVVDMLLVVRDSAREEDYVPALESAGYELRIREPDWYEHRMFKRREPEVNLHVFPLGCEEIDRMLLFRDHLRGDAADRALYARTKLDLSRRTWKYVQEYADAKGAVVEEIMGRARAGRHVR